jgi:hypothetical protein
MPHGLAAFAHHHPGIATAALVLVLLYLTHHGRHYRKRRRHGLSVWMSLPGPFGSRISKRF